MVSVWTLNANNIMQRPADERISLIAYTPFNKRLVRIVRHNYQLVLSTGPLKTPKTLKLLDLR